MSFEPIVQPIPTRIGRVTLILTSNVGLDEEGQPLPEEKDGLYRFTVLDENDALIETRHGSLQQHLSSEQQAMLVSLLDWARVEAEGTLPTA